MARSSELLGTDRRLIFAAVGTDHHPFDRMVGWIDAWARAADPGFECFVQRGTSDAPSKAASAPYLSHEQLQEMVSRSVAVVCHGGPATIMDARRAGVKPIVVPRRRALKEHVDDHQVLFAHRVAEAGFIELVESEDQLRAALDAAIADPSTYRIDPVREMGLDASLRRFEALADALLDRHRHGGTRRFAGMTRRTGGAISTPRDR